jgi:hypothetical protein
LEYPSDINVGDELLVKVVDVETVDEPTQRESMEEEDERLNRVKEQLGVARTLLPSPLTKGDYFVSTKGFEELLAKGRLELAVEILEAVGELNDASPQFWEELLPPVLDLGMYDRASRYRKMLE